MRVMRSRYEGGFTLVELLLAITVFALLASGLIGATIYGRAATANAGDHARAVLLAQEGVAATRNIGDATYANLTLGSHGLVQSGGVWTLSGTSDTNGIYTRTVAIASGGTNRLTITSTVTWTEPGGAAGSVVETGEMTNWPAAIKLWSNAILAGSASVAGAQPALKIRTQGNYAYSVINTTANNNFIVTNISNPASPAAVGAITLPSSERPTNIFVSGNYAYVTCTHATATLVIINISNPAAPSQVGSYTGTGTGDGASVFVNGTTAYFGRGANAGVAELSILNVATPTAPTLVGSYGPNTTINGIYVSGNYAYMAVSATGNGLMVVNVTTPSAPTLAKAFALPNSLGASSVKDIGASSVMVGAGTALYAINVVTPTAPTVTGTFTAAAAINDLDVDITNQYAFLGTAVAGGGSTVLGANTVGGSTDTADNNHMSASKFVAGASGTISTLLAHVGATIQTSPNNTGQMALYSGTSSAPTTKLQNSASVTLTANAWISFPITATAVTSGTTYWLVYNNNATLSADNGFNYTAGAAGSGISVAQTYGTWPTSWSGGVTSTDVGSFYGTIVTSGTTGDFQVVSTATLSAMTLVKTVVPGTAGAITGISYDTSLDTVAGAGASTTQPIMVFTRN